MRVPPSNRPIGVLDDQEKLGLDAHVEHIAALASLAQRALEIDPRTVWVRPAVNVEVRRKARDPGFIGQGRERRGVGPGVHVVRFGTLPHSPNGAACEPGSELNHSGKKSGGHQLDLGCPVNVNELHHQVLDPQLLEPGCEPGNLRVESAHASICPVIRRVVRSSGQNLCAGRNDAIKIVGDKSLVSQ